MFEQYGPNLEGVDYICGDIHGCFSSLERALKKLGFNREVDRLFCCGDLVDRGPESHRVMEFLEQPWFHSVYGNHEDMTVYHYLHPYTSGVYHRENGGLWFNAMRNQKEVAERLYRLPRMIELNTKVGEKIAIVHADIPTSTYADMVYSVENMEVGNLPSSSPFTMSDKIVDKMIYSRTRYKKRVRDNVVGVDKVIVGHTIVNYIERLGNVCFIDTGLYATGRIAFYDTANKSIKVIDTGKPK